MNRFHVHISVDDLSKNIHFYTGLFGMPPSVEKADYARWMLEDPRVNFAISQRGSKAGVNHLGFQVDSEDELKGLRARVHDAEIQARDEPAANCCYAKSDKYWVQDPQGLPWETFHTLGNIPVFGEHANEPAKVPTVPVAASSCGSKPQPAAHACC